MKKTFIIFNEEIELYAIKFLQANRTWMNGGTPLEVVIHDHKKTRSQEQHNLLWLRLGEISAQAWINGNQFSAAVWHRYYKEKFLPEEAGPTDHAKNGYKKWSLMPDGDRHLSGSTTELTVKGMNEYLTQIEAHAVSELGVMFSADRGFT